MLVERILLKGGCVLTLDPDIGNYPKGDVLIEDNKIAAVGPQLRVSGAEVIDATNTIVMPGFIDTHRHIWEGILKNIAPDALLDEYFRDILGVLAPVYRPQDAYAGNLVSALGAIDGGVTTILDWSHIATLREHADAAIAALQESGLRAVFGYGTPNLDMVACLVQQHPEPPGRHGARAGAVLLVRRSAADPRPGPARTRVHSGRRIAARLGLARDLGIRISVHVGVGGVGQHGKLGEFGRAA